MKAYARKNDPVTSWDAANSLTEKNLNQSQKDVYNFIKACGNVTQNEAELIVGRLGNYTPQRVRTAFTELESRGLIRRVEGKFRNTIRGRRAQVWETVNLSKETV